MSKRGLKLVMNAIGFFPSSVEKGLLLFTVRCPFCGVEHAYGVHKRIKRKGGSVHRRAHCSATQSYWVSMVNIE